MDSGCEQHTAPGRAFCPPVSAIVSRSPMRREGRCHLHRLHVPSATLTCWATPLSMSPTSSTCSCGWRRLRRLAPCLPCPPQRTQHACNRGRCIICIISGSTEYRMQCTKRQRRGQAQHGSVRQIGHIEMRLVGHGRAYPSRISQRMPAMRNEPGDGAGGRRAAPDSWPTPNGPAGRSSATSRPSPPTPSPEPPPRVQSPPPLRAIRPREGL